MPTKHTHIDRQNRVKTPHQYPDGKYVVSSDKHARNYHRVDTLAQVNEAVARGLGVRVSEGGKGERPSFVKPATK